MPILALIGFIDFIFSKNKKEKATETLVYSGAGMILMAIVLLYVFLYYTYPTIFWFAILITILSILFR